MSSPIATVGLFYDSEDLQRSDLGVFCRVVKGLNEPPTVRGTDSIVPARAGRIEGLRVNDVVAIELECWVQPDAALTDPDDQLASFRTNLKDARALFATNRSRGTLLAVLEDGTQQSIEVRPLNVIWNEVIPSLVASASVALEAYDDWAEVS